MHKTKILFVCPDNALLGPLAEAYLNEKSGGLLQAFSAGVSPASKVNPAVPKLLSAHQIVGSQFEPKSLDVFMMPHAPYPDRIVYLSGGLDLNLVGAWEGNVAVHHWNIACQKQYQSSFAAASEYFRRIRMATDRILQREWDRVGHVNVA